MALFCNKAGVELGAIKRLSHITQEMTDRWELTVILIDLFRGYAGLIIKAHDLRDEGDDGHHRISDDYDRDDAGAGAATATCNPLNLQCPLTSERLHPTLIGIRHNFGVELLVEWIMIDGHYNAWMRVTIQTKMQNPSYEDEWDGENVWELWAFLDDAFDGMKGWEDTCRITV